MLASNEKRRIVFRVPLRVIRVLWPMLTEMACLELVSPGYLRLVLDFGVNSGQFGRMSLEAITNATRLRSTSTRLAFQSL
jgi:hypothetical protein